MTRTEWFLVIAFVGAVYGLSFVSPEGALLLAGLVAVTALVNSDVPKKVGIT